MTTVTVFGIGFAMGIVYAIFVADFIEWITKDEA